jgi:hypothetical protein
MQNTQHSEPIVGVANQSNSEGPTLASDPSLFGDDDDEGKSATVASSTSESPKPPPKKLRTATTSRRVKLIETQHTTLTDKFKELRSATSKTSDAEWASFVSKVDAASSEIKAVIGLLDASQSPQQSAAPEASPEAGKEDINKKFFDEYVEFYNSIRGALMDGDNIKSTISNETYDKEILTAQFLDKYSEANNTNGPVNKFIMAIKSESLNAIARNIRYFQGQSDTDINHNLLKVVLTALNPESIPSFLPTTGTSYDTLNNLIEAITAGLRTDESLLQNKIKELYTAIQAGGGSSSSLTTSKKNRKSHKSYHTSIGKTKKHHRGNNNKISFVH